MAEYNSAGSLLRRYVHGLGDDDDPVIRYEGAGTSARRYLLADERGSIIAEMTRTGSLLQAHQYDAYGNPKHSSSARFRYTGQILIPGTELYYYKARVYHPKLGRFMQTDPIGYQDGMNWYAYAGNDPLNLVDPTGKSSEEANIWAKMFGFHNSDSATVAVNRNFDKLAAKARSANSAAVHGLRGVSNASEKVAMGSLAIGAVGAAGLQPQVALPALTVSGVAGITSATAGGLADILDTNLNSGLETAQSALPLVAGSLTKAVLTTAKVPAPLAIQAAVAVEGFTTIIESVDDKVNGALDER